MGTTLAILEAISKVVDFLPCGYKLAPRLQAVRPYLSGGVLPRGSKQARSQRNKRPQAQGVNNRLVRAEDAGSIECLHFVLERSLAQR